MTDAIQQSTSTLTATPPQRRPHAAGDDAPGFSYAMASASLERQAAQSLETHGAAPKGSSPTSAASPTSGGQHQADSAGDGGSATTGAPANAQPRAQSADNGAAPASTQPQSKAIAAAAPTVGAPVAPSGAGPQPPTAAANGAKAIQAAAPMREQPAPSRSAAAKTQTAKPATPPSSPTPVQEDFARLLARRLDKSSSFEFRLDPPEMGRVEGRLTLGDDGKATLALKFENQTAFDMFARDEQALRQTLADAGFDFAQGDFVFSFREDGADRQVGGIDAATTAIAAAPVYEAAFSAPWTAGAIDIRV